MGNTEYLVSRRMKRPHFMILNHAFATFILVSSLLAFISTNEVNGQSGTELTVGYFTNRPLSYKVDEELRGLSIDLLRKIGASEGWQITFREGTRDQCHQWLLNGDVDLVAGMEERSDLKPQVRFSNETVASNWGVIYTSKGWEIDSILELEGKWIGVVKDDIHYSGASGLKQLMDSFKVETFLVTFDNYNEVIEAIEDGNVDAGVLNHLLGQAVEDDRDISRTGIMFNPVEVKFAYPSNDTEAEGSARIIDRNIREMKNDRTSDYYTLLDEYIGGDTGPDVRVEFPRWLIQLFFLVLGIALFLLAATLFFRYRVQARTRELEEANRQLDLDIRKRKEVEERLKDERNRSVFYLDLLIHDMGNINQGLLNSTQIYHMVKKDREKADNVHETISQLVGRSVGLVKNVHKFAQATTAPFRPEPIDLIPIVKKALASVVLSFPEVDISYEIKAPDEKVIVPAEPLIEEVFYNIFHNAVKYHEKASPMIEVNVMVDRFIKKAVIEIADRGRGIPDNMKTTLFTRAHKANEAMHLGIGLSLVKVLLDRYKGTIEVHDRVAGDHRMGTNFIVTLPLIDAPLERGGPSLH
ncbi:MAG: transporter substrate-binding domain-containing protein [Candidatus Thermoplasmatota archaeon]|nr:transporter substrate-binding domain-containing protein [Candidatus Thermoplasmatota archaeon]